MRWSEALGKDQKLENGQIRNVLPFFQHLLGAKHSAKGQKCQGGQWWVMGMLPGNIKLSIYILFTCAKMAMSKDMLQLLTEWLQPWEWWWVSNTEGSINSRQVFGLSPSWWPKRIAFHWSPATGYSGAKFPKWRHWQYFLLFLKGGAELSPTSSLKWIELAKHFFEKNLSFMSQMKYDCLHMCVLISKQPDGLADV